MHKPDPVYKLIGKNFWPISINLHIHVCDWLRVLNVKTLNKYLHVFTFYWKWLLEHLLPREMWTQFKIFHELKNLSNMKNSMMNSTDKASSVIVFFFPEWIDPQTIREALTVGCAYRSRPAVHPTFSSEYKLCFLTISRHTEPIYEALASGWLELYL